MFEVNEAMIMFQDQLERSARRRKRWCWWCCGRRE